MPFCANALRDKTRRLHFLDEGAEISGAGGAALRRGQRLADDHEAAIEQAHAADAPGVGLQLLHDTGGNFEVPRDHRRHHFRRGRHAHDLRLL